MTNYGVMKYGTGAWFINNGSTIGTFLCQPTMSVTNGYLNATFANATNDNDVIYFVFKIEMY